MTIVVEESTERKPRYSVGQQVKLPNMNYPVYEITNRRRYGGKQHWCWDYQLSFRGRVCSWTFEDKLVLA